MRPLREFFAAVTLAVIMAASGPAFARVLPYKWLPPVKYDHAFAGRVTFRTASMAELRGICGASAYACAFRPARGECLIYIAPVDNVNINAEGLKMLRRHEVGHCNGWGALHFGGRFSRD